MSSAPRGEKAGVALGPSGHLVEASTGDGVRLHGFLQRPAEGGGDPWLWIIVPGVAGNFYSSTLLSAIAEAVLSAGHASLRINTSGRDQIAFASRGGFPTLCGSAFEKMDEAVEDIGAWSGFAAAAGYTKVGLLGHSLGAIKILRFLWSNRTTPAGVAHAVLLSPPRLNHPLLRNDMRHGAKFARDFEAAAAAVESGESDRLLQIRFPQPLYISAATFVDKYGPHDRHDYMTRCGDLAITAAWVFGEQEVRGQRTNFADCDSMLRERLDPHTSQLIVVSGADHNYTGVRDDLQRVLRQVIVSAASAGDRAAGSG